MYLVVDGTITYPYTNIQKVCQKTKFGELFMEKIYYMKIILSESQFNHILLSESYKHYHSPELVKILQKYGRGKYNSLIDNYFLASLRDNNIVGVGDTRQEGDGVYSFRLDGGKYLYYNVDGNPEAGGYVHRSAGDYAREAAGKLRPGNEYAVQRAFNHVDSGHYQKHYKYTSDLNHTLQGILKDRDSLNRQLPPDQQIHRPLLNPRTRERLAYDYGKVDKLGDNTPGFNSVAQGWDDNALLSKRIGDK